jgi:hypothetical protein
MIFVMPGEGGQYEFDRRATANIHSHCAVERVA